MASVLVVDDDAGIRESVVLALRKAGHRIFEAEDAATAVQLMRDHRVDVVVSDIYIPGDDGLTLLRSIKRTRRTAARHPHYGARNDRDDSARASHRRIRLSGQAVRCQ